MKDQDKNFWITTERWTTHQQSPMENMWQTPVEKPEINRGELHLWRGILSKGAQTGKEVLSPDELDRMDRFRFKNDRDMFLHSHSLLRRLLANYLNQMPEKIKFSYTHYGKPFLEPKRGEKRIEFNLSHAGDIILIGVTFDIPIGVDVEKIKPLPEIDQIAAQFFSSGEQRDLSLLSGSSKLFAYYDCWTRKEAVIKASGEGLSMPLDSFRVSLLPGEPARLIESLDHRQWTLLDLNPQDGYAAAAATPFENLQVSYFSADKL
jgi:4'-phosphopantetheinyl transferase